jgi:hypothetical protein
MSFCTFLFLELSWFQAFASGEISRTSDPVLPGLPLLRERVP